MDSTTHVFFEWLDVMYTCPRADSIKGFAIESMYFCPFSPKIQAKLDSSLPLASVLDFCFYRQT